MRYIDTSIMVAYLTPEVGSAAAEALLMSAGSTLAVSSWMEIELWSALGVKQRRNQLTLTESQSVIDRYTHQISRQLFRISTTDSDHLRAINLLRGWRTALRGGDSLHLAIAQAHQATVYTLDVGMAKAGTTLGLPIALLQA